MRYRSSKLSQQVETRNRGILEIDWRLTVAEASAELVAVVQLARRRSTLRSELDAQLTPCLLVDATLRAMGEKAATSIRIGSQARTTAQSAVEHEALTPVAGREPLVQLATRQRSRGQAQR